MSSLEIPPQKIPRHIAIIMDGNGRWAEARGLSRREGHKKGAEAAQRTVEALRDMGVEYVTLFTFSSENWQRPASEVSDLLNLIRFYLKKETAEMHKSGARLRVIGNRERLPADIVSLIENAEAVTKDNSKITVVIALSYGGRQDIVFAAKALAARALAGTLDISAIDEEMFAQSLMTQDIPDPDLMIRSGGESRISNFLMWQLSYTELFFTDTLWPDFDQKEIGQALEFYRNRDRRFGGVSQGNKAGQ